MKKKSFIFIIFLFVLYFIFYSFSYTQAVSSNLKKEIFRLHIIANSDSEEDQKLKLQIRDSIVEYLSSIHFNNKNELMTYLQDNKDIIYGIAKNVITENGFDYDCSIEIGSSYYPQKKYKNLILPSGTYNGMRIKIGSSKGHNWWCVLFPPMCLIDSVTCKLPSESESILENSLTPEAYNIISSDSPCYKFKFKIVDLINNLH